MVAWVIGPVASVRVPKWQVGKLGSSLSIRRIHGGPLTQPPFHCSAHTPSCNICCVVLRCVACCQRASRRLLLGTLPWKPSPHNGVVIDTAALAGMSPGDLGSRLQASLDVWSREGKKAVWLHVDMRQGDLCVGAWPPRVRVYIDIDPVRPKPAPRLPTCTSQALAVESRGFTLRGARLCVLGWPQVPCRLRVPPRQRPVSVPCEVGVSIGGQPSAAVSAGPPVGARPWHRAPASHCQRCAGCLY
jgi:hypothetical protein